MGVSICLFEQVSFFLKTQAAGCVLKSPGTQVVHPLSGRNGKAATARQGYSRDQAEDRERCRETNGECGADTQAETEEGSAERGGKKSQPKDEFLSPNAKKARRPEDVCGFPAADFMCWI